MNNLTYTDNNNKSHKLIFIIPGLGMCAKDFEYFKDSSIYRVITLNILGSNKKDTHKFSITKREHSFLIIKFIEQFIKKKKNPI
jgi:hypothetical protein